MEREFSSRKQIRLYFGMQRNILAVVKWIWICISWNKIIWLPTFGRWFSLRYLLLYSVLLNLMYFFFIFLVFLNLSQFLPIALYLHLKPHFQRRLQPTYKGKAWVATLTFQRDYFFSIVYHKIGDPCPGFFVSGP